MKFFDPPRGLPKCAWTLRGQKVTPNDFLSPLKHTWQLLLPKLFDLMKFDFDTPRPPPGCPQGSEGDPEWIFVTLETYLTTFVSETFWFDEIWFWHPQGPPIAPAAPRGQGVIPNAFLSSLKHTWQLLLATFFDLMKFEFEPLRGSPECPRAPRGRGSNSNSLFRALRHEDLTLSIWLGYYKRFPRSFTRSGITDKPKSTRKYLLDGCFCKKMWKNLKFGFAVQKSIAENI